jgi:hypothetical protein
LVGGDQQGTFHNHTDHLFSVDFLVDASPMSGGYRNDMIRMHNGFHTFQDMKDFPALEGMETGDVSWGSTGRKACCMAVLDGSP